MKNTPGITGVSPRKSMSGELTYLSETRNVNVAGVNKDFKEIQGPQMESGSFLTDKDSNAVVLGYDLANDKFGKNISHRSTIGVAFRQEDGTVVKKSFKVKGILQNSKLTVVSEDSDYDLTVFIPISTMNEMTGKKNYGAFLAMANSPGKVREVAEEVDSRLARNFGVPEKNIENEDSKPYTIFNQVDVLEQTGKLGDALNSFLLVLALISLFVGLIGIMNIMLVTVMERTREIGIMKSVGYSSSNALSLYLLEAVMVSLFGGVVGTAIGGVGAYIIEIALKLPPVFPLKLIEIGIRISVFVGISASLYPARKAALMNPVDALRHE